MVQISEPAVPYSLSGVSVSCGMRQLWLFSGGSSATPEHELKRCFQGIELGVKATPSCMGASGRHHCAIYMFSDKYTFTTYGVNDKGERVVVKADTAHHGHHLAEYIQQQGLGTVTASPEAINPNTGNRIRAWFWNVDHKALTKWCADRGIKNYNDTEILETAQLGYHA